MKVAVCSRSFSQHPLLRDELLAHWTHVKFNDQGHSLAGAELVSFLQGYEAAIVALEVISSNVLAALPELKVIGKYGVGLDKLDFDAMERYGVQLGWTPGVNAHAVAELTLGLALTIVRRLAEGNRIAMEGRWTQIKGRQISSLCYGVIGCGNTGKALVRLLRAFGCEILVHDILAYPDFYAECGVEAVSLQALLSRADIVSLHVPKNASTLHMLDAAAIDTMKWGSYLINTARGGLVDEAAVLAALDAGKLAAAAFDVLEDEPPVDTALINHPRIFVTPHIAGSSEEAVLAMGRAAIRGLTDYRSASCYAQYR